MTGDNNLHEIPVGVRFGTPTWGRPYGYFFVKKIGITDVAGEDNLHVIPVAARFGTPTLFTK